MSLTTSVALPPATIVMTFHNEGAYAQKSLWGFQRIRDFSASFGNRVDLICVLDCAEDLTAQIVKNFVSQYGSDKDQILETSYASLAAARNTGIHHTRTEYVGFIDGDDFFSSNWVNNALQVQQQHKNQVLCMPSHVVNFGNHIAIQAIVPSRMIPKAQMMNMHYWVSSSFGPTDLFKHNPYNEKIGKQTRFAFEDWDFNLRCVSKGVNIEPVQQTYLFYRRRGNSMLQEHLQFNSFIPPSDFFLNINL
ncbi:glycosyltransferase family 2 protein [Bergeriella denitrificans]|uniref:Putative glycosyl transferase n=1 Tax=Bergeriella denitrificans TaxID=494 RepID=A0A378UHK9_BERDE|nr:glycosyltransferase family 2 protein [Bergeriella denitrificans]STZ76797.1 putative glycosyl transferase [Bergeriella denitrificans]